MFWNCKFYPTYVYIFMESWNKIIHITFLLSILEDCPDLRHVRWTLYFILVCECFHLSSSCYFQEFKSMNFTLFPRVASLTPSLFLSALPTTKHTFYHSCWSMRVENKKPSLVITILFYFSWSTVLCLLILFLIWPYLLWWKHAHLLFFLAKRKQAQRNLCCFSKACCRHLLC